MLNPATLPRGQQFKGNILLASIACMMSRKNVVCCMGTLRLPRTRLQRHFVVKSKCGSSPTLDCWINRFAAKIAVIAIAFKDSLVVHRVYYSIQLASFTTQIMLSLLVWISLTPRAASFSVRFLGLHVVSSIIFLVFAVPNLIMFLIFWLRLPNLVFRRFTHLALVFSFIKLLWVQALNPTFTTKFVSRARDRVKCMLFDSSCTFFSIDAFSAMICSSKSALRLRAEITENLFPSACFANFAIRESRFLGSWFHSWVKLPLTVFLGSALIAIRSSSPCISCVEGKYPKRFLDTACFANFGGSVRIGEIEQGKLNNGLLNSMVELGHGNSLLDRLLQQRSDSVCSTSGLDSYASILSQTAQFVQNKEVAPCPPR